MPTEQTDEELRDRDRRTALIARLAVPIAAALIDNNRPMFEPDEINIAKQSVRIAATILADASLV